MPRLKAIERSPFDVSTTIPVVIVLVKYEIFPPTIIIAPTSDNALPNATRMFRIMFNLHSCISVMVCFNFEARIDIKYSFKK